MMWYLPIFGPFKYFYGRRARWSESGHEVAFSGKRQKLGGKVGYLPSEPAFLREIRRV
jgi:hypothetical protein